MHAPAPQHNAWKAQNRSYRNWFSPPNMWVPGVNSGHRAWWQTLLPATKPSHWSNDFKCFLNCFILLIWVFCFSVCLCTTN